MSTPKSLRQRARRYALSKFERGSFREVDAAIDWTIDGYLAGWYAAKNDFEKAYREEFAPKERLL